MAHLRKIGDLETLELERMANVGYKERVEKVRELIEYEKTWKSSQQKVISVSSSGVEKPDDVRIAEEVQ